MTDYAGLTASSKSFSKKKSPLQSSSNMQFSTAQNQNKAQKKNQLCKSFQLIKRNVAHGREKVGMPRAWSPNGKC